jgi:hypothetical protein
MKKTLLIVSLCLSMACAHAPEAKPAENRPESNRFIPEVAAAEKPNLPFKLEIVPSRSQDTEWSIEYLDGMYARSFQVILTNLSKKDQAVYQEWNSWGWDNLSFEFKAQTGEKYLFKKVRGVFTRNVPGTYTVHSGKQKVYTIEFNTENWSVEPAFKESGQTRGMFKVRYQVWPSAYGDDAVRTGWQESREYELTLNHHPGIPD